MGNDALSPELLLHHVAFVRRLARAVTGSEQEADDVVQETMLAALERPPRPSNLRGWLAVVARRFALRRGRAERRERRRRVLAARPERVASTAEAVARFETERRLVETVGTLPEACRAALYLRYYEGLAPAEIARREGVSVATVKSRLKRALRALRGRLDGAGWLAAVGVLAWPGKTAAAAVGVTVMGKKAALVFVLVALLAATTAVYRSTRDERAPAREASERMPPAPSRRPDRAAPAATVPAEKKSEPEEEEAVIARPVETAERGASGLLVFDGRVVDAAGNGIAGVEVVIGDRDPQTFPGVPGMQAPPRVRTRAVTDALGRFATALRDDEPFRLGLAGVDRGRRADWNVALRGDHELLFRGFAGWLLNAKGRLMPRGLIVVRKPPDEKILAEIPVRGGAFAAHGLGDGPFRLTFRTSRHGSETTTVIGGDTVRGDETNLRLQIDSGAILEGIVYDEDGRPKHGVWVRATRGGVLTGATSRSNGRFIITGLEAGKEYVLQPWLRGYVPHRHTGIPAGKRDVELRLDPGLTAEGVVYLADGLPAASVHLRLRPESGFALPLNVHTSSQGRFTTGGLPDEVIHVEVLIGSQLHACGSFRAGATGIALHMERQTNATEAR